MKKEYSNENKQKREKKRQKNGAITHGVWSVTKHNITQLNNDKTYSYTRKIQKKIKTTTKKMENENQHTANNK